MYNKVIEIYTYLLFLIILDGELIKLREEINRDKNNEKINKTKTWFFERINKFYKPLARLMKKKRKKTK